MKISKNFKGLSVLTAGSFKFMTVIIIMLFGSANLFAQSSGSADTESYYGWMIFVYVLITVITFLILVFFGNKKEKPYVAKEHSGLLRVWIRDFFVAAAPIEKEHEILMEDDYDGIKELDNRIPPWFNYLFYATIIFGIIYLLNYQVFKTGKNQYQEYDEEMREAAVQKAALVSSGSLVNENTVTRLTDAGSLDAGKIIFKANCTPCHGEDGGGVVGPNLTDKYWIHGGGIKNIFKTISNGVPSKGMPTWDSKFNATQIQEIASYVMSLQGTHPANPKPPQGKLYEGD